MQSMESWHKGGSQISFLLRLALVAMVCGLVIAGNGDRGIRSFTTPAHGFISPGAYHQIASVAVPLATATPQICPNSICTCTGGAIDPGDGTNNLAVIGACTVGGGLYQYKNVNIYKDVNSGGDASGGSLTFLDAKGAIDFWAISFLVEKKGSLIAGAEQHP